MGSELTDAKGDRWVVRTCESEDACVVVERWLVTLDGEARHADEMHIPRGLVDELTAAIREEAADAQ